MWNWRTKWKAVECRGTLSREKVENTFYFMTNVICCVLQTSAYKRKNIEFLERRVWSRTRLRRTAWRGAQDGQHKNILHHKNDQTSNYYFIHIGWFFTLLWNDLIFKFVLIHAWQFKMDVQNGSLTDQHSSSQESVVSILFVDGFYDYLILICYIYQPFVCSVRDTNWWRWFNCSGQRRFR